MLRIRRDIASISPYVPGRRLDEVARELGVASDEILKLASNESPEGPFPGVIEAALSAVQSSNRYPDNDFHDLRSALSKSLDVPHDHLWFGGGSTSLLSHIALALGGESTSSLYAWPSFVMYRIATRWAGSRSIEVPLTQGYTHDLSAMKASLQGDTSVIFLCNPNNPTGTTVSSEAIDTFVSEVPPDVLIVIDEAYHDFVSDPSYATALPHALSRANVLVLRTFSKIFALASHRIGFAVARPETIRQLMKAQPPFSVSQVAQVAATVSLGQTDEIQRRARINAEERRRMFEAIEERGIGVAPSQANFVYCKLGDDSMAAASAFSREGIIIRPMSGGWVRVTVGLGNENSRFVETLDALFPRL